MTAQVKVRKSGGRPRPAVPDTSFEQAAADRGARLVAGIDEAGRGPLAGPVCAAAVILASDDIPAGLADSKTLTPARREALYEDILRRAQAVGIGLSPAGEIDRINILQATFAAMRRAVAGLARPPDWVLVDGRHMPAGLPCPGEAIVKGDARSVSIAAASIVAKVTRDRLMQRLDRAYPEYGFAGHAGYPTAAHRQTLARIGPCPFHRMSFAPLRDRR